MLHGVRSALALSKDPDPTKARALRNPEVAPHLSFADWGGHGYSMVTVTKDALETEFVCIPDPLERATTADGGPLRYRVSHRVALWGKGDRPKLEQKVLYGNADYSI
jgi:alkaline phosphatase D